MITNAYRDPFLAEMQRGERLLTNLLKSAQGAEEFLPSENARAIYAAVSSALGKMSRDLENYKQAKHDAKIEDIGIEPEFEEEDYDLEDA